MLHYPDEFNIREVNKICEDAGVNVLYLPAYHCELNPIENFWSILKQKLRDEGCIDTKLPQLIEIAKKSVLNCENEKIKSLFDHIACKEQWFRDIEGLGRSEIDEFVIQLEDNDISDSESDDDIDYNTYETYEEVF